MSTSDSQNEAPHSQNSKPKPPHWNLNLAFEKAGRRRRSQVDHRQPRRNDPLPSGYGPQSFVPDIVDYAAAVRANWRDLLAAASVVRPMLQIEPRAPGGGANRWCEAAAAVVVACILQRGNGDPVRPAATFASLPARRKPAGSAWGPMLMALTGRRNKREETRLEANKRKRIATRGYHRRDPIPSSHLAPSSPQNLRLRSAKERKMATASAGRADQGVVARCPARSARPCWRDRLAVCGAGQGRSQAQGPKQSAPAALRRRGSKT